MKSMLVQKCLAKSTATSKGRMKIPQTGIRSTPRVEPEHMVPEDNTVIPEDRADAVKNIFCFAALVDKQKGTLYPDTIEALPVI